jgi:glycosyltransferase involved in cell wall biosynthesis
MAKVLKRHHPRFRLVFFCPKDLSHERRGEAEQVTGERTFDLPARARWRDMLALLGYWDRDFYGRCREAKIDLVFEQAKYLGASFPVPVLAWIGDLQHCHLPQYFSFLHRLMRDVGYRSQAMFRKHVMVSSESAQSDIIKFFGRPRAKVHVVPFAVTSPLAIGADKIEALRGKYGLPENYLFLPNQFWRHKNHQAAFHALRHLRDRGREPVLALCGAGHDFRYKRHFDDLKSLSQQLGIEANLRWLGTIPYDDLLQLIAGARALLNPSLFEGWSTTVEEAKCLGAPIVLSGLAVHREQASGRAVFFDPKDPVSMADAIDTILAGESESNLSVRLSGAQTAYEADIERYAQRLCAAIEGALSTKGAALAGR